MIQRQGLGVTCSPRPLFEVMQMLRNKSRPVFMFSLVAYVVIFIGSAGAQESQSAPLATELSEIMAAGQLDAVAVKDASDEGRYIAALAFPGQLLVVSAQYEVPLYVDQKIENRQFRDVYIDLNTASIDGTKVLVTDVGANGLLANDAGVDMYDDGSGVLRLDGTGTADVDYESAVADADREYARLLRALIDQAR